MEWNVQVGRRMPEETKTPGLPVRDTEVKSREKQSQPTEPKHDDEIGKVNGSPTPLPDEKAVESSARRIRGEPPADDGAP